MITDGAAEVESSVDSAGAADTVTGEGMEGTAGPGGGGGPTYMGAVPVTAA